MDVVCNLFTFLITARPGHDDWPSGALGEFSVARLADGLTASGRCHKCYRIDKSKKGEQRAALLPAGAQVQLRRSIKVRKAQEKSAAKCCKITNIVMNQGCSMD